MSQELDYSIIIPTRNRPRQLDCCLRALAALDYPRDRFEVLVVDDGSAEFLDPVVARWSSRLPVRLLTQSHGGPATARNRGAREARGGWLAFLDDDCEATPGWLQGFAHARALSEEALGGATQNEILHLPCSVTSQLLVDYVCQWQRSIKSPLAFFPSNNFAVSRAGFHRVGGFSETFPLAAAEDREFCHRWVGKGGSLRFVPDAVVGHFHNLTLRPFWRQHLAYGRGAYTFRQILSAGGKTHLQLPRVDFYVGLFGTSRRAGSGWGTARTAALLMLSQVASLLGFLYESRLNRGPAAQSGHPKSFPL